MALAHRPSEEALTTVARRRAVVFAGRAVVTNGAVGGLAGTRRSRDGEVSTGRGRVVERRQDGGTGVEVGRLQDAARAEIDIAHVMSICTVTTRPLKTAYTLPLQGCCTDPLW